MNLHIISSPNGYALGLSGYPVFVNGYQSLWFASLDELQCALWTNGMDIVGPCVVSKREQAASFLDYCLTL